jgi:predicted DNA-binding protein (MmcQ/YjbR family)
MELNIEDFRTFCLSLGPVSEDFPFDNKTLVFKVGGKIFALVSVENFEYVNLKCDPERVVELREEYPEGVRPGYHMNKTHWNSVYPYTDLPPKLFLELVRHSYQLIVQSLPKKTQQEILNHGS